MEYIKNILYTPGILINKVRNENVIHDMHVKRIYPKISIFSVPQFYFSSPTHIIDSIYLGNVLNAQNDTLINKMGIERIINITDEIPNYFSDKQNYPSLYNEKIKYFNYRIKDINEGNITSDFKNIIDFYRNNNDKRILVHCFMGASRSVIIVMLYLIHFHNMSPEIAVDYIRQRRPYINPNKLFYDQLVEYYFLNYKK